MDHIRVDFAFLSDYGEVANKIYAQGIGIDAVLARQVPVRHPQLFMVAQMRAPKHVSEVGIELLLSDPSGNALIKNTGRMRFTPPAFGELAIARFAMGFYNLDFKAFGTHQFMLSIEGKPMIHLPLQLIQVGRPAPVPVSN